MALFKGRHFDREIIVLCVRWYLTYKLSSRDLVQMMEEREILLTHTTILRWVQRFVPEFERRWNRYSQTVSRSWRCDETYVKVKVGGHRLRERTADVLRSVVDGVVGDCKSEISKQPVPLDAVTLDELRSWRALTIYAADTDWAFASERLFGKMPIWANASLQKVVQPAARKARIIKVIGWHTFRHTYSTMLSEHGDDVKVVQELMRHAKLSTTMEIYTHPRMEKKREAQSKVVDVLFGRQRLEVVA